MPIFGPGKFSRDNAHLGFLPKFNSDNFFIANDNFFATSRESSFAYHPMTLGHIHTVDVFKVKLCETLFNLRLLEIGISSISVMEI